MAHHCDNKTNAADVARLLQMIVELDGACPDRLAAMRGLLESVAFSGNLQHLRELFRRSANAIAAARAAFRNLVAADTINQQVLFGKQASGGDRFKSVMRKVEHGDAMHAFETVLAALKQTIEKAARHMNTTDRAKCDSADKKVDSMDAQMRKIQAKTGKCPSSLVAKLDAAKEAAQLAYGRSQLEQRAGEQEAKGGCIWAGLFAGRYDADEFVRSDGELDELAAGEPTLYEILKRRNDARAALIETHAFKAFLALQAMQRECGIVDCMDEYVELAGALFRTGGAAEKAGANFEADVLDPAGDLHEQFWPAALSRVARSPPPPPPAAAVFKIVRNARLFDQNGKPAGEADGLVVDTATGEVVLHVECKANPFEVGGGIAQVANMRRVIASGGWFDADGERLMQGIDFPEAMSVVVTTDSHGGCGGVPLPGCLRREVLTGAALHAVYSDECHEAARAHLHHCADSTTHLLRGMKGSLTLGTEAAEQYRHLPAAQQPILVLSHPECT